MTDRPTVANVAYLAVNAGQQWLQNLETEEKTKEKTANLHGTYLSYGTKYQKHESWDDDDALRSNVGDDGGDGGDGDSTVTQRHMSSGHNGNSKHRHTHHTHTPHTHSLSHWWTFCFYQKTQHTLFYYYYNYFYALFQYYSRNVCKAQSQTPSTTLATCSRSVCGVFQTTSQSAISWVIL